MQIESQPIEGGLTAAALFLVVSVEQGDVHVAKAKALLGDLSGLIRSVGFKSSAEGLTCIAGIGSSLWDRMFPNSARPQHLHPFKEINGVHHAPSTPGDLLFHIRAASPAFCFELASIILSRLTGSVKVEDEVHGFKYFDNRDLLGFVDGTENPNGSERVDATIIEKQDPHFAGGSYVIVQKYMHDLEKWSAFTTEHQEGVIGRFKLSDVEIADDKKTPYAHNVLTTINENGQQLKILRDNMPFGSIQNGDNGTYFIGYACDPARTEKMLNNMFVGDPPGNYDRILDVSTAVTGCLFFVPTVNFLDDLGGD